LRAGGPAVGVRVQSVAVEGVESNGPSVIGCSGRPSR
jgi:hypothetical protein